MACTGVADVSAKAKTTEGIDYASGRDNLLAMSRTTSQLMLAVRRMVVTGNARYTSVTLAGGFRAYDDAGGEGLAGGSSTRNS